MGDKTYTDDGRVVGEKQDQEKESPLFSYPPVSPNSASSNLDDTKKDALVKYVAGLSSEADLGKLCGQLSYWNQLSIERFQQEMEKTNLPVSNREEILYLQQCLENRLDPVAKTWLQRRDLTRLEGELESNLSKMYQALISCTELFPKTGKYHLPPGESYFGKKTENEIDFRIRGAEITLEYGQKGHCLYFTQEFDWTKGRKLMKPYFYMGSSAKGKRGWRIGTSRDFLLQLNEYLRSEEKKFVEFKERQSTIDPFYFVETLDAFGVFLIPVTALVSGIQYLAFNRKVAYRFPNDHSLRFLKFLMNPELFQKMRSEYLQAVSDAEEEAKKKVEQKTWEALLPEMRSHPKE